MLDTWKRERQIRKVLRGIARQRVALFFKESDTWVIECALQRNDRVEADLATCLMRGWVEATHKNMPTGDLTPDGRLPSGQMFDRVETHYRLTEGGWAALNRAHAWALVGVLLAGASLVTTVIVAR
jgi:hypothetical protein